jgi:hypothetical protein
MMQQRIYVQLILVHDHVHQSWIRLQRSFVDMLSHRAQLASFRNFLHLH